MPLDAASYAPRAIAEVGVRRAGREEVGLLADLNRSVQRLHHCADPAYKDPPSREVEEFFASRLSQAAAHVFVASVGAHAAGYVLAVETEKPASAFKHGDRYLELDQIAVEPDFRRLGVGRRLVEEVEALARQRSLRVQLSVAAFNKDAIAFYQRLGYQYSLYRFVK